jgi:phosphoserine phosphatase RsbU/P
LRGRVALVTAFLATIDGEVLRYANAGHVPPLLAGRQETPRELPTTGLPLGITEQQDFREHELPFGADDVLFAGTDGLHEARRGTELFGHDRVSALVAEHAATLEPQALVELAHAEAVAWAHELTDDIAILALRRR